MATINLFPHHGPDDEPLAVVGNQPRAGGWNTVDLRIDGAHLCLFIEPQKNLERVKQLRTALAKTLTEADELIRLAEEAEVGA